MLSVARAQLGMLMTNGLRDLPARVWQRILLLTAGFTIAGTIVSVIIAHAIMSSFGEGLSGAGLVASIALPILIGVPTSLLHLLRGAQLRIANEKLLVLASTDWLTSCLNRRAFTSIVDGQLNASGAFLVIDADHFKDINDRHGHDRGDEVLQLIAATIKSSVRDIDVVGRIGGEEFGVFLQGADHATAIAVAERIRFTVQQLRYAPDGTAIPISVSVGGAWFDGQITFSELFRVADQRLYGVKKSGRNQADLAQAEGDPGGEPSSAAA